MEERNKVRERGRYRKGTRRRRRLRSELIRNKVAIFIPVLFGKPSLHKN
jgi:hypothetical protein